LASSRKTDEAKTEGIVISLDDTVRDVLNEKIGEGKWAYDIKYVNYPVGYVAVNGELTVYGDDGLVKARAPGLAMVPLRDDPTATCMNAVAISQRVAAKLMGWDVSIPEVELALKDAVSSNTPSNGGSNTGAKVRNFAGNNGGNQRNNSRDEDDTPVPCDSDNCLGNGQIEGYEAKSGKYMPVSAQVKLTEKYGGAFCQPCATAKWKAEQNSGGGGNRGYNGGGGNRGNYQRNNRFN
jgi:hypothetical protein